MHGCFFQQQNLSKKLFCNLTFLNFLIAFIHGLDNVGGTPDGKEKIFCFLVSCRKMAKFQVGSK